MSISQSSLSLCFTERYTLPFANLTKFRLWLWRYGGQRFISGIYTYYLGVGILHSKNRSIHVVQVAVSQLFFILALEPALMRFGVWGVCSLEA